MPDPRRRNRGKKRKTHAFPGAERRFGRLQGRRAWWVLRLLPEEPTDGERGSRDARRKGTTRIPGGFGMRSSAPSATTEPCATPHPYRPRSHRVGAANAVAPRPDEPSLRRPLAGGSSFAPERPAPPPPRLTPPSRDPPKRERTSSARGAAAVYEPSEEPAQPVADGCCSEGTTGNEVAGTTRTPGLRTKGSGDGRIGHAQTSPTRRRLLPTPGGRKPPPPPRLRSPPPSRGTSPPPVALPVPRAAPPSRERRRPGCTGRNGGRRRGTSPDGVRTPRDASAGGRPEASPHAG